MIALKRAYEPPAAADGKRLLIERLWPRGVKKEKLQLDDWTKDVAPSSGLRRWFGHDPAKWETFQARYFKELDSHAEAWDQILKAADRGRVTLVYSSHDTEHNAAVALKGYLENKLRKRARSRNKSAA